MQSRFSLEITASTYRLTFFNRRSEFRVFVDDVEQMDMEQVKCGYFLLCNFYALFALLLLLLPP